MKSHELVSLTIKGQNPGRTPVYGWLANLKEEISKIFGSVEAFEDHYVFNMAHIFGDPPMYDNEIIEVLKKSANSITPEMLLDTPMNPVDRTVYYNDIRKQPKYHKQARGRFCYIQTALCD